MIGDQMVPMGTMGPQKNADLTGIQSTLQNEIRALNNIGTVLASGLSASLYPSGATPLNFTSGNGAAAIVTATLPGAVGQTTYITGFDVSSSGASSALVVDVVVTDTGTAPILLGYTYATGTDITGLNERLTVRYANPVPASASGVSITVTLPSLGAGNTHAIVNAYGFRL